MGKLLPKRKFEATDQMESSAEYLEVTQRLETVELEVKRLSNDVQQIKKTQRK